MYFSTYFPVVIKYFPKCEGKGSFLKSQIKSLTTTTTTTATTTTTTATANTGNVQWSFSPLQGFIYPTKKETHHLELFNSQEDNK